MRLPWQPFALVVPADGTAIWTRMPFWFNYWPVHGTWNSTTNGLDADNGQFYQFAILERWRPE